MRWFINKFFLVLGSNGLATILLLLLLLLTFFGTLEQMNQSLFDVQHKYFDSFILVHWIGLIPIPMPGGYLLMALLAVNLTVGGIFRVRWRLAKTGILIAHLGIAFNHSFNPGATDTSGAHGIDTNILLPQFHRQCFGKSNDGPLGCRVW
jgi:hypothetical protein